jgi:DNA polymerase I
VRLDNRSWYDPVVDARLHTGDNAANVVASLACTRAPGSVRMAMDIETPGLSTHDFVINCITAAWRDECGHTQAVLLDGRDKTCMSLLWEMASTVCFHNSPFDIPIMYHNGLVKLSDIAKVTDTMTLVRLAEPDQFVGKNLEACAQRWLGHTELSGGMLRAFHAAGHKNKDEGYRHMNVDSPTYALGAICDTVVTLDLEPVARNAARNWLRDHPFVGSGAVNDDQADAIIAAQEIVNRVGLRRSAVGINVDRDYLMRYAEQVDIERNQASALLAQHGLEGGAGKAPALVTRLDEIGELPPDWPRTPTGKLRATKDDLDELDHPLAAAQRFLATSDKVLGYLEKVERQAKITGRCHPQCNVLGASQTGRASYSIPEVHQFPAAARPIMIADEGEGLTSIDWSSIEPVTMGIMANDQEFLAPYERGEDLYEPLMRATGQNRDISKTTLLAGMYGQGIPSLARRIGHTRESAAQVRRQMLGAMPGCANWMNKVAMVAEQHKRVITAGGRILPVPVIKGDLASHKSVNHVVQGSAYDLLAYTVCEMDARGIGEFLVLTMHDEVVVDTRVADEVREIMSAAPAFLTRFLGRPIALRTDRKDMGRSWAKV